ncbi:MAG: hypothetical protein RBQ71_02705 [Acholeplasmataceae bacterium]|jgi:hypothetical protein|nr:hypothetical protein [Acholeplasmataceae bacterium]
MKANSFLHSVVDYIKDILDQFNTSKLRETEIYMSSNDYQSR